MEKKEDEAKQRRRPSLLLKSKKRGSRTPSVSSVRNLQVLFFQLAFFHLPDSCGAAREAAGEAAASAAAASAEPLPRAPHTKAVTGK